MVLPWLSAYRAAVLNIWGQSNIYVSSKFRCLGLPGFLAVTRCWVNASICDVNHTFPSASPLLIFSLIFCNRSVPTCALNNLGRCVTAHFSISLSPNILTLGGYFTSQKAATLSAETLVSIGIHKLFAARVDEYAERGLKVGVAYLIAVEINQILTSPNSRLTNKISRGLCDRETFPHLGIKKPAVKPV